MNRWPVTIELPVQWGDMDSFGHVNNVVYLRWFESARIAYGNRIGLADLKATQAMLDRAATKGYIHPNKAARLKSRLVKKARALAK